MSSARRCAKTLGRSYHTRPTLAGGGASGTGYLQLGSTRSPPRPLIQVQVATPPHQAPTHQRPVSFASFSSTISCLSQGISLSSTLSFYAPRHVRHASSAPPRPAPSPIEGAEDIAHSTFIASASPNADFNPTQTPHAGVETKGEEKEIGRLSPTNSHLFKLVLPLPASLHRPSSASSSSSSPSSPSSNPVKLVAFLLHPSQPLSHLSRLIAGSLPPDQRNADINYLALTGQESDVDSHLRAAHEEEEGSAGASDQVSATGSGATIGDRQEGGPYLGERQKGQGRWQEVSWSQSTDLSDFIKQSCLNERFKIVIRPDGQGGGEKAGSDGNEMQGQDEVVIPVVIPSFASRTEYLRKRLLQITKELDVVTRKKKS